MDIHAFFERIRYEGPVAIDLDTLTALQTAFVRTVPFENLVIHQNTPINFESAAVFEKIITRQLGGVCYECNGLFYDLLATLPKGKGRITLSENRLIETIPGQPRTEQEVSDEQYDNLLIAEFGLNYGNDKQAGS